MAKGNTRQADEGVSKSPEVQAMIKHFGMPSLAGQKTVLAQLKRQAYVTAMKAHKGDIGGLDVSDRTGTGAAA
jgi:hypothetical protein